MNYDLIFGIHSIAAAIKNPLRLNKEILATEEGLIELEKKGGLPRDWKSSVDVKLASSHKLQEEGKRECSELDFHYGRVPSGIFLKAECLEEQSLNDLYLRMEREDLKVLVLDQVTDVHNLGALVRTASFYGVDSIIMSKKGGFRLPPSFFRIASGASEFVHLVNVKGLPRTLAQLEERGMTVVGLSEHLEPVQPEHFKGPLALALGAEETGLSHAMLRVLKHCYALQPKGETQSLNVSVAGAVAMEKFFG